MDNTNNPDVRHRLIHENMDYILNAAKESQDINNLTILQIEVTDRFGSVIAEAALGKEKVKKLQKKSRQKQMHYCVYFAYDQKTASELLDFSAPNAKENVLKHDIPDEGFLLISMASGGNSYALMPRIAKPRKMVTDQGSIPFKMDKPTPETMIDQKMRVLQDGQHRLLASRSRWCPSEN